MIPTSATSATSSTSLTSSTSSTSTSPSPQPHLDSTLSTHPTHTTISHLKLQIQPCADPVTTSRYSSSSSTSSSISRSSSQSQLSSLAKLILMTTIESPTNIQNTQNVPSKSRPQIQPDIQISLATTSDTNTSVNSSSSTAMSDISNAFLARHGVGPASSDTPEPSAPSSPKATFNRHRSGSVTPRMRPTTLDIPGLTKSKASPDGRIAKRDVGSKLVIVMVGLPARGKSYITKKLARYLNWLQHDTRIFNVGEKRRIVNHITTDNVLPDISGPQAAARALMDPPSAPFPEFSLPDPIEILPEAANGSATSKHIDQSAVFFDPNNKEASNIRTKLALDTLNDLLDYILDGDGSVGILDATNSTIARRRLLMDAIRLRHKHLGVLFVESVCEDETLLETNMRLKLSGPDYKDKDPVASLVDFKKRVSMYEKAYVPLGEFEEKNNIPYIKMIDVGKKLVVYGTRGFLSTQALNYLSNFNLAGRQIWITRHGESHDNVLGKIGGDSDLTENGLQYGKVLARFVAFMASEWEIVQQTRMQNIHNPPSIGNNTPPNPHVPPENHERNFCVWTSMLKRSIQTANYFHEDEFDVKQMRMLNELYAGSMEGLTYTEIQKNHLKEFKTRQDDKLSYRYPGPGGEGYLDVTNRLRPVIGELERMTDHCLLITHRSVARVLLAYFLGLKRDDVATLYCPLGMLYCLEPKPYGVEFKAYRYNPSREWFDLLPDYSLTQETIHH